MVLIFFFNLIFLCSCYLFQSRRCALGVDAGDDAASVRSRRAADPRAAPVDIVTAG
jgi:hypothetical protein